MMDWWN